MTPPPGEGVPRESLAGAFAPKKLGDPTRRSLAGLVPTVTPLPVAPPAPAPASAPAPTPVAEPEAAVDSAPPRRKAPRRSGGADRRPSEKPEAAPSGRKQRVGVWVPISIVDKLKERTEPPPADQRGSGRSHLIKRPTITDVVLDAARAHHKTIAAEFAAQQQDRPADDPFEDQESIRREVGEPQTQITLLLTPKNKATLQALADAVHMSRAKYVTEVLRRAL